MSFDDLGPGEYYRVISHSEEKQRVELDFLIAKIKNGIEQRKKLKLLEKYLEDKYNVRS